MLFGVVKIDTAAICMPGHERNLGIIGDKSVAERELFKGKSSACLLFSHPEHLAAVFVIHKHQFIIIKAAFFGKDTIVFSDIIRIIGTVEAEIERVKGFGADASDA